MDSLHYLHRFFGRVAAKVKRLFQLQQTQGSLTGKPGGAGAQACRPRKHCRALYLLRRIVRQ